MNLFLFLNFQQKSNLNGFLGHNVAGYACAVGFSPDGSYVISGDAHGNLCVWDWKSTKLYRFVSLNGNFATYSLEIS